MERNNKNSKKIIYVDCDNEYLKGLMTILKEFVVEEICNTSFSEMRLNDRIKQLRLLYGDERCRLSENPSVPKFGSNFSGYKVLCLK